MPAFGVGKVEEIETPVSMCSKTHPAYLTLSAGGHACARGRSVETRHSAE